MAGLLAKDIIAVLNSGVYVKNAGTDPSEDEDLPDAELEGLEGGSDEDLDEGALKGLEESDKKYNNIAEAARDFVNNKPNLKADHCWDWVNKVYQAAGYRPNPIYQDLNYTGKVAGNHRASESLLRQLQPGDWLYINNQNQYDSHGNHSVIFLGWAGTNVAQVASYFSGRSHIHTYDINKWPVVHISKPVPAASMTIKSSYNVAFELIKETSFKNK